MSEYLYLEFRFAERLAKTKVWEVISKKGGWRLGLVKWHGPWRQYTFRPEHATIWNHKCLADVQDFLKKENELHRKCGWG